MSKVGPEGRSYKSITKDDLQRLAQIARRDRDDFFARHREWAALYRHRLLCVALCQGAALHYRLGTVGVNDFDLYSFYITHPKKHWYAKRIRSYDFGDPKFGQSVDRPDFIGRRVDCLGRDITASKQEDAATALRRYLREGRTETARLLAAKAVVLLEPECGRIIWPINVS
jgi:hypothetical protein